MKNGLIVIFAAMARSIGGLTGISLLPSRVSASAKRSVRDVKVSGLDQTNYDGTARFERKTDRMLQVVFIDFQPQT